MAYTPNELSVLFALHMQSMSFISRHCMVHNLLSRTMDYYAAAVQAFATSAGDEKAFGEAIARGDVQDVLKRLMCGHLFLCSCPDGGRAYLRAAILQGPLMVLALLRFNIFSVDADLIRSAPVGINYKLYQYAVARHTAGLEPPYAGWRLVLAAACCGSLGPK
jgi:hypothetical protein